MSSLFDVLTVALGSGGAVSTLLATYRAWRETEKQRKKTEGKRKVVRIEVGKETVVLDADNIDSATLKRILLDITRDIQDENSAGEPASE
jgi:Effector Associated Constant Component 1